MKERKNRGGSSGSALVNLELREAMIKRVGRKRAVHLANAHTYAIQAIGSFIHPGGNITPMAIWNLATKEFRAATTPNETKT